jgi:hypothetical protein
MPGKRQRTTSGRPLRRLASVGRARSVRSRARGRNAVVSVPRNKLAFPQSMRTKLRYVERVELDISATTSAVTASINALGLYDPYAGLGGHQPRGFDQFMATYSTYTVTGTTCSANFVYLGYDGPGHSGVTTGDLIKTIHASDSSDTAMRAQTAVFCGIHKGTEILGGGTAAEQMEKDRTQWTVITPQSGAGRLSTSLVARDFYGAGAVVGADGFAGDDSSNPENPLFFEIWAAKAHENNTNITTKVLAYVTVEYDVVFTEPKTLGAS